MVCKYSDQFGMDICILFTQALGLIQRRTCSWIQLYLDMGLGRLWSVLMTPEAVEEIMGKKFRKVNKQ